MILAAAGSTVGIGLAWAGVEAIRRLGPENLPRIDELQVDGTVLLFAVVIGAVSAVLSGLAPSLRLARPDLTGALAEGGRGSAGPAGTRTRNRLVVIEVAAAVVLLVGAGLLGRSFAVLLGEDLGFDPEDRHDDRGIEGQRADHVVGHGQRQDHTEERADDDADQGTEDRHDHRLPAHRP